MSNSSKFVTGLPVDVSDKYYTEKIPWDKLIDMKPCSMQRDHESRAWRASKHHLSSVSLSHSVVFACEFSCDFVCEETKEVFKKGERRLLDGNTRCEVIRQNLTDEFIKEYLAVIFPVENKEQMRSLYNAYDSPSATEKAAEKLIGVLCRERDINIQSPVLKKGCWGYALGTACHITHPKTQKSYKLETDDIKQCTALYQDEISILDSLNPRGRLFKTPMIASLFVLIKHHWGNPKYQDRIKEIVDALSNGYYNFTPDAKGGFCGIAYVVDHEKETRARGDNYATTWTGNLGVDKMTSRCLHFFSNYIFEVDGKDRYVKDNGAYYKTQTKNGIVNKVESLATSEKWHLDNVKLFP